MRLIYGEKWRKKRKNFKRFTSLAKVTKTPANSDKVIGQKSEGFSGENTKPLDNILKHLIIILIQQLIILLMLK